MENARRYELLLKRKRKQKSAYEWICFYSTKVRLVKYNIIMMIMMMMIVNRRYWKDVGITNVLQIYNKCIAPLFSPFGWLVYTLLFNYS